MFLSTNGDTLVIKGRDESAIRGPTTRQRIGGKVARMSQATVEMASFVTWAELTHSQAVIKNGKRMGQHALARLMTPAATNY